MFTKEKNELERLYFMLFYSPF